MAQAFIIMQIGNTQLDGIYKDVMVPALTNCGLDAKRVDKHNQGGLLKSEIIAFIETSDIIIADLTNERPNCYLEVGYAMGVAKFKNLILTAREDHAPASPNYTTTGPRVHFDLAGYDILFWHPDRFEEFQTELEQRVKRRQAILGPSPIEGSPLDQNWVKEHRIKAIAGLKQQKLIGFAEVVFRLSHRSSSRPLEKLLSAARSAQIHASGWPIGVVLDNEFRPVPTAEGIVTVIAIPDSDFGASFDYWALRREGDFYLLQSLSEDSRATGLLQFDKRIVRTTEILLYCARLYSRLDVAPTAIVSIDIRYGGLLGRVLTSAGRRHMSHSRKATADEIQVHLRIPLGRIEVELVKLVQHCTGPLFEVFDFFQLSEQIYQDIVNGFVESARQEGSSLIG